MAATLRRAGGGGCGARSRGGPPGEPAAPPPHPPPPRHTPPAPTPHIPHPHTSPRPHPRTPIPPRPPPPSRKHVMGARQRDSAAAISAKGQRGSDINKGGNLTPHASLGTSPKRVLYLSQARIKAAHTSNACAETRLYVSYRSSQPSESATDT